ncbi:MAG: thioredoxin domain-containing protein [Candidatus Aminicenantales bacterium]
MAIRDAAASKGRRKIGFAAVLWPAALLLVSALGRPSPPAAKDLVGPLTRERILETFPDCRNEMTNYAPLWAALERIRSATVPVRIEVFLATSSTDSRMAAGRFFKILDQSANPNVTTAYLGLPGKGRPFGREAADKKVDKTPAFIVYIDGQEKGRIAGLPDSNLEEALAGFFPDPPESVPSEEDELLDDWEYLGNSPHSHLNLQCGECHIPG